MLTALAGGVGASKLLVGLKYTMYPLSGTAIVNTADDEEFFGLHVSPDLDTVVYSLSGLVDVEKGWGVADDTFNTLDMLARLGCETWFKLGDRDLAIHIYRTMRLRQGATLTQVTEEIASKLGAGWKVFPMTDDRVRTIVETEIGTLPFQTYFVKFGYGLKISKITFEGVEKARPTKHVIEALRTSKYIVICPSNPVVSIGPILALMGIRDILRQTDALVLAVSPIIGGKALRGPAAEMMRRLGVDPSPIGVVELYKDFLDIFVMDEVDAELEKDVRVSGVKTVVTNTVMRSFEDRIKLAKTCLKSLGMCD